MKWADAWGEKTGYFYTFKHNLVKLTAHWCLQWSEQTHEERKQVTLIMYPYIHNLVKLTTWCWQWSEQMHGERKQVTFIQTQFSKTYRLLMLAMKWADAWGEKTGYFYVSIHNLVKLTAPWCWQWREQVRRETDYSGHASIHAQFSKTHHLICWQWSEQMRRETGYILYASIHTQFSKSHLLMLAMKWADAWGEKTGYSGHASIHTQFNSPADIGNEVSRCMRRENRLLWSCIHACMHAQFTFWCWQ